MSAACANSLPCLTEVSIKNSNKVIVFILVFFILMTFFWVLGFSFNFSFLRCKGKRRPIRNGDDSENTSMSSDESCCDKQPYADPGRTFVYSIVTSLIVLFIIWVYRSARGY